MEIQVLAAKIWISNVKCRCLFYVWWVRISGDCSFYWYWWNYLPSLFKLSFHKK
jgi:hypothetical protein